jgi:hypothetical protein
MIFKVQNKMHIYFEFVAVDITRLIIKNSKFCPHYAVLWFFLWFSKLPVILSLYNSS